MKIYLATWQSEEAQGRALTKIKKRERLLSFFYAIPDQFVLYIKTGENENLSSK